SYNVWPLPMESPSHGPQTMANDPADPDASPLGWHDTGLDSYTITRGNNAYAYEDFNADNNPGFSPDGGPSLVFDFPFDPNLQPTDYQPLAVTSLFYWNNIMHDVMWHHGFDEPSGNFQANNGPNGGVGNDAVNAEAQDGSGFDNANFFTPAEGSPPRMQMYRWSPGAVLEALSPPDIAGEYALASASGWGPPTFDLTEDVVQVIDADGNDFGCAEPFQNEADLVGKIALIQRGTCEFGTKALNAEEAGAVGVIIYNCEVGATDCSATSGEELVTMAPGVDGASVTIPPVFAQRRAGLDMLDH